MNKRKLYLVCRVSWEDLYYGSYLPNSLKLFSSLQKANKFIQKKNDPLWKIEVLKV